MNILSHDFSDGERIPQRLSCEGEDVSPSLRWEYPPDGTAHLALTCEDPDAPSGTFLHWLVTGIDPHTTQIPEGETPAGSRVGRGLLAETCVHALPVVRREPVRHGLNRVNRNIP